MKRFGFAKFAPKPKTEKDWVRIYNRHKYEVPTVKKLSLTVSAKGPGQTGARCVISQSILHLYLLLQSLVIPMKPHRGQF